MTTEPRPRPVSNVGELRAIIAGLPDDMPLHVSYHVAEVVLSEQEEGYFIDGDPVVTAAVDNVPGEPEALCFWTESFYEGVENL